ncbi:plasmid pRiA4b ORF-3 family protein [Clostridia bacterium]|nr:plasmid pRiA4b ORF-3 family protein [Clostridia bacterium]
MTMPKHTIYEFYAELDDFKPKIWRRFQVRHDITLARLGYIVQVLFEMTASHLMAIEVPIYDNYEREQAKNTHWKTEESTAFLDKCYRVNGEKVIKHYIFLDESFESLQIPHIQEEDIARHKVKHVISAIGDVAVVNYDFGDDWRVTLRLEKVFDNFELPGDVFPRVLEGSGFGIVEDVGGTPGLEELVKAFKKKKGASYEQFKEWLGIPDFDIAAFDIDDMNFRIKQIPRIYKQSYEDYLRPTQRSIDLIERKYLKGGKA